MPRENKRKWTYEKVLESAKNYNHIFDWELGDRNAYRTAKRYGYFKEATAHMTKKVRKVFTIKYSDEDILQIALKFNTPKEWYSNSPSTYSIAHQRNLIGKATAHMDRQIKEAGYYTEDRVRRSALKFTSTAEWIKNEPKFYAAAYRQGLMGKTATHLKNPKPITSHFKRQPTKLKFTKEEIISAAKKFNTRKEWNDNDPKNYSFAYHHGFLEECCMHMERLGSMSHRCIYFIKIPVEMSVYVGLTFNYKKRMVEHLNSERFKKILRLYGKESVQPEQVTDYLDKESAANMERYYINLMKEQGWKILNRTKGGGLGGKQTKWTEETILKNILKYNSYKEWMKSETGAYAAALDLNIIKKIDKILPRTHGSFKFWTQEKAEVEAKGWKTKSEFRKNAVGAYEALKKYNVFKEATKHMLDQRNKKNRGG